MVTLFSFGYYGWGNATGDLVRAVDAVEASRGFGPPIFADTRIRRNVRAKGFQGAAFAAVTGADRYVWMPRLGNQHVLTRTGPKIQIADPSAAAELLGLALAERSRRVIFLCGCEWPREAGEMACHRVAITELVLANAASRRLEAAVEEWPGGEPCQATLEVEIGLLRSVMNGRNSVPLVNEPTPFSWVGLPWGSPVNLRCGSDSAVVIAGPAGVRRGEWQLPVYAVPKVGDNPQQIAATFRAERGLGLSR